MSVLSSLVSAYGVTPTSQPSRAVAPPAAAPVLMTGVMSPLSAVKDLAYGGGESSSSSPVDSGSLYRLERGTPYKRNGRLVFATPQFKALTLYSPTSKNAQIPGVSQTGVSVSYPSKTK